MILRLTGILSHVDARGRLILAPDAESADKIERHTGATGYIPITVPARAGSVRELVSLDVVVFVRLQNYTMISKYPHNLGEKITGTRLILTNILRAAEVPAATSITTEDFPSGYF